MVSADDHANPRLVPPGMIGNGERIRVRGLVQGVGFRPTVWRLAHACKLVGEVRNDGAGVLIRARPAPNAPANALDAFCQRLRTECPPLARIDAIERAPLDTPLPDLAFRILASSHDQVRTAIAPDAATCPACRAEIADPANRRHGYAFTNCTHCGPRLSIIRRMPYDRADTSMSEFRMCPQCQAEYADPADRRFHAQPNACPACGPRLWLLEANADGRPVERDQAAVIAHANSLLRAGQIVAIKGIGGFHLACDASDTAALARLRRRKHRDAKPFALMARDLAVISNHCLVSPEEEALLSGPAAPIVLLPRRTDSAAPALPEQIAPGHDTLGFMLPYSPLHHLLLAVWERPLVMTSANLSDEPQCADNDEALALLGPIADALLVHDRTIVNRLDDSLIRQIADAPRLLRRARGYAPEPLTLPEGFTDTPAVLACGGELKSTFCLLRAGEAILSQHLGDLQHARAAREYRRTLALYLELFEHVPERIAIDLHRDYHATHHGEQQAGLLNLTPIRVQHHHAHLASVLADNGWPVAGGAVLGLVLDGLGLGADGTLWGGELLLGDYRGYRRLAHLRPVAMPGGTQAILEPWRMLYAQLRVSGCWEALRARHPGLPIVQSLQAHPLATLDTLIARGLNAPLTSSAGRLCDAVAATLGLSGERIGYEGQAAIELETLASQASADDDGAYLLQRRPGTNAEAPLQLDPAPIWPALFADLAAGVTPAAIAARFHRGLAKSLCALAIDLAHRHAVDTIALSGGVWQNRLLSELAVAYLAAARLRVLLHRQVPTNDGGLALGQACIAALADRPHHGEW